MIEDQEEFYVDSQEDDLEEFQEYQQEQINLKVMNHDSNKVQDDAQLIKKSEKKEKPQKKKELTQEQRQARELKLLNSRKYFEIAKIMYLQHVSSALQQTQSVKNTFKSHIAEFFSLLSPQTVAQFVRLHKGNPFSIIPADLLKLLKKAKKQTDLTQNWEITFWSLCEWLGIGCRKVHFFEIDSIVEEIFFQLKYHASELQRKKENKKSRKVQALKIEIEHEMSQFIESEEETQKYLFFEDYQFNAAAYKEEKSSQRPSVVKIEEREMKRENNFTRKKTFKTAYFQLFDTVHNEWILVNSHVFELQRHETSKKIILQGKFVVGFFSTRLLHFKEPFQPYTPLRVAHNTCIEDLTMYFEDNHRQLNSRRKRLGLKWIMRKLFEEISFDKNTFMLKNYDSYLSEKTSKIELQYQLSVFPRNKQEMMTSNFFVIPSLLPKYTILSDQARPLPDIKFNEEDIFLKKDVIAVTSKLFWVDRGRKVKSGEVPVKKTENKSKNLTQLFLYEQTVPFELSIQPQTGKFISDDEFNSVYIPTDFTLPEELTILNKKISVVCNKAGIRHIKVIQGFSRSMGRVLPNQIGYLIYKEDKELVQRLFEERQQKLEENKVKNRLKQITGMWNKLFKKIQLSQWSRSFQDRA